LSASGCAFKAAALVDVLRAGFALGKTDFVEADFVVADFAVADFAVADLVEATLVEAAFDNTDVARDHSFHCIANAESDVRRLHYIMWG
jgi:uncharacterized protein YjbI with pentapeptide repeats